MDTYQIFSINVIVTYQTCTLRRAGFVLSKLLGKNLQAVLPKKEKKSREIIADHISILILQLSANLCLKESLAKTAMYLM